STNELYVMIYIFCFSVDLFVMFRTVRDMGGYHQVTAQQLWKQVYNMLGGNPRSTSAATCTRRHYEKLLLPYECHMNGVEMNTLSPHPPKNLHYTVKHDMGLRPAKRKLISIPLHQPPRSHQAGQHANPFPVSLCYPHYYHPSHAVLPPHIPIASSLLAPHSPPEPQPRFSFDPYHLSPTERVTEPLDHLRYLAERYKTSSGLNEPLNLSVKASKEGTSRPVSSFAPPSSSKNPKFLNKPFPLYTAHFPQALRNEICETQDDEAGLGETYPAKARETYVIDVKAITASSSPTYAAQSPSSPRRDSATQPKGEREGSPEVRGLNLSHILPHLPQENRGEMEIEIPLSVFNNWLRLCRSSPTTHGDKQPTLPTLEEPSGKRICPDTDVIPANVTFRMNPQHPSSVAEDLRLRQRSPTPVIQTSDYCNDTSQDPFTSYKPVPSGGILKNAASRDVYPFDQQDINKSYSSKPSNCWEPCDQQSWVRPIQAKSDSNPLNFAASKSYSEDRGQGGKSEIVPSALLMMDPSSTSLLRLTTEEVMKLKKIISSSS
ncbi:AT-rich interactive domain-containing protein 5B, partial [Nibea albiflora]